MMDGVITGAVLFGIGVAVGGLLVWLMGLQHSRERADLYRVIGQMQMQIEQLEGVQIPQEEM
jgi:uncharacterized membrane protein YciS (DUF1049 family)